jgi:hypothetical protein
MADFELMPCSSMIWFCINISDTSSYDSGRHDAYIDSYFVNSQLLFYVNLCKSGERSEKIGPEISEPLC